MRKLLFWSLVVLFVVSVFSVTIEMAMWGAPHEEAVYKKIVAAFEAKHPGIKVKVSVQPWGTYWQQLQTRLVAGNAPDVFAVNGGWLQVFASKGVLYDITNFVTEDLKKELFPEALKTFIYKGHLYGLPRDFNTYVVFYNKTLFDEYGIPYPSVDWDWNDFLEIAKKLTRDKNGDGKIDTWGTVVDTRPDVWMAFVWQNGGEVMDTAKKKSLIYSKESIEAFQFLTDLILKYRVSPTLSQQQAFGWNPFGSGKIGMYITGMWMVPIYKTANFKWDVQVMPMGKKMVAMANAVGFVVYAKSKHPKEAFEFVKFVATEGQKYLLDLRSSVPCAKSAAFSKEFLDPSTPPKNKAAFLFEIPYSRILPFHPRWNELWNVWVKYPELMFTGKISVEEGVRKMHEEMNKILSE